LPFPRRFNFYDITTYCRSVFFTKNWADTAARTLTKVQQESAKDLYQIIKSTPFVSLYRTSSWLDDLAEYLSVYQFTRKLKQPFRIILRKNGREVFSHQPMKSKLVQRRIKKMKRFYKAYSEG